MYSHFMEIDVFKQNEVRRQLTAERTAVVHEARLAARLEERSRSRVVSALSLRWRRLRVDFDRAA